MSFMTMIRPTLDRARRLPAALGRTGRWPLVLGALLLLAASSASVVATTNSPPVFTSLVLSKAAVYEGETVTLTGAFTDPNASDRHTILVYWYGGDSNDKQKVLLPAGQSTFQVSHTYSDVVPIPSIKVVVYDHTLPPDVNDNTTGSAWDAEFLPFQLLDTKAQFIPSSIKVTKDDGSSIRADTEVRVTVEGDLAPLKRSNRSR
jgi:hypothetical protein